MQTRPCEYTVVEADTPGALSDKVTEALHNGAMLHGPLIVSGGYIQAIVYLGHFSEPGEQEEPTVLVPPEKTILKPV